MTPEHARLRDYLVQVQIDNLGLWRAHLVDLTPAQLEALHEAAIGLADAICDQLLHRRQKDRQASGPELAYEPERPNCPHPGYCNAEGCAGDCKAGGP